MKKVMLLIGIPVVLAPLFFLGDSTTSRPIPAESILDDPVLRDIDEALFQKVPLLDTQVDFPRPPEEAENLLGRLAEGASPHPRVLEALAGVQLRLFKYEEAEAVAKNTARLYGVV